LAGSFSGLRLVLSKWYDFSLGRLPGKELTMRVPKLVKRILKYLPILAILAATLTTVLLGKDLYPGSLDFESKAPLTIPAEANASQPLIVNGTSSPCPLSTIYTSLPPKCRTLDGEFIPLPGASNIIVIPGIK
jgi:hypothetical protein